jgi:hypothetical protein
MTAIRFVALVVLVPLIAVIRGATRTIARLS